MNLPDLCYFASNICNIRQKSVSQSLIKQQGRLYDENVPEILKAYIIILLSSCHFKDSFYWIIHLTEIFMIARPRLQYCAPEVRAADI